jgi:hypothetical protein
VGFPLVLDTTTGKACYSTTPKPADGAVNASYPSDGSGALPDSVLASGPFIPMCEK